MIVSLRSPWLSLWESWRRSRLRGKNITIPKDNSQLENARLLQQAHPSAEDEETPEEAEQAVENTAAFQMHQRIADLLSSLEPEEARLLTLRFGLEGGKPMTPQETGRILGLTPDEVVAREAAALAKLRK